VAQRADTYDVATIENFAHSLRRMAHDGDLAVLVRSRAMEHEMFPEQQVIGLFIERQIRVVIRMHEKVRRRFVVSSAAANETPLLFGKVLQFAAVAVEGRSAATFFPAV
jgi:hypothetical protein